MKDLKFRDSYIIFETDYNSVIRRISDLLLEDSWNNVYSLFSFIEGLLYIEITIFTWLLASATLNLIS